MNILQSMVVNNSKDNIDEINSDDNYVILVDTFEEEEEHEEETKFVSDKSLQSSGSMAALPNLLPYNSQPSVSISEYTKEEVVKRVENESSVAKFEETDDGEIEIYRPESETQGATDKKVPSTFDEAADRAIVFSNNTGQMRLGTKAMPYYWYIKGLVSAISRMWAYTIPNQAHFLGLIRSDEVEILLSIDENGNIEFVDFLKKSYLEQNSLNNSCQKAVEYAGNIGTPPQSFYEEYQEDGKIYIPFRFIYKNFSND